jgi:hypothetical protein
MWDACKLLWSLFLGLFRSRASLEAENLALRQQIIVLQRTAPKRLRFNTIDRMILVGLYRLFPDLRDALAVVRPETVIRWHRAGFRAYWRWRSRPRLGRQTVPLEIRQLIREMSLANPLWGAPRNPWRTAQTRHRYRADECVQIYGAEERATVTGLADLSTQPCRRHRRHGLVRGADDFFPASLWSSDPAA